MAAYDSSGVPSLQARSKYLLAIDLPRSDVSGFVLDGDRRLSTNRYVFLGWLSKSSLISPDFVFKLEVVTVLVPACLVLKYTY